MNVSLCVFDCLLEDITSLGQFFCQTSQSCQQCVPVHPLYIWWWILCLSQVNTGAHNTMYEDFVVFSMEELICCAGHEHRGSKVTRIDVDLGISWVFHAFSSQNGCCENKGSIITERSVQRKV